MDKGDEGVGGVGGDVALASLSETLTRTRRVGDEGDEGVGGEKLMTND